MTENSGVMSEQKAGLSRKITASEVAERAGVSKYSVSRTYTPGSYVSDEKRQAVLKAAEELGYRPNLLARSLSKQRSGIIGIVVDTFSNFNLLQILPLVSRQLQEKGFSVMLLSADEEQHYEPAILQAVQFQIDGLIFLGATLPDQFTRVVKGISHIPMIVLYRNSDLPNVKVIDTDNIGGGREIARLLVSEGCTRFGYMQGPPPGTTRLDRLEGFENELSQHGLKLECLLEVGNYHQLRGQQVLSEYLDQTPVNERIDALFCENDMLALGAIDALRIKGGEIAIVGYDGVSIGESPAYELTTYKQPLECLCREAVRSLDEKEFSVAKFFASGELILRGSHRKKTKPTTLPS